MRVLLAKEYDANSLNDIERDVQEAFETELARSIPADQYNMPLGVFKVKITWENDTEKESPIS